MSFKNPDKLKKKKKPVYKPKTKTTAEPEKVSSKVKKPKDDME